MARDPAVAFPIELRVALTAGAAIVALIIVATRLGPAGFLPTSMLWSSVALAIAVAVQAGVRLLSKPPNATVTAIGYALAAKLAVDAFLVVPDGPELTLAATTLAVGALYQAASASSRAHVATACGLAIAITVSPVLRNPVDDGFPLSTYPMFASPRPTTLTMSYPLGVATNGERRYLRPSWMGTGEVLQAYTIVAAAVRGGAGPAQALCRRIAERIAASGNDDISTVRIVTGKHDALDVLLRDQLGSEVEKTRCQVRR